MKYIYSTNNDPFINLATEEYLLKNTKESIFMIYQNAPCVIIGKNQNPHTEVGIDYIKDNDILLVRRNSGGGAVYQDLGNLNFSFILKNKSSDFHDFKKYSQPIVDALNKYTTSKVYFSGRNDLLIDEQKISGTAQMVVDNNLVHHGTILFDVDFSNFGKILLPNNNKLKTKGIKSVASRVSNVKEYLPNDFSPNKIALILIDEIANKIEYLLTNEEKKEIEQIANAKRESINFIIENKKEFQNRNIEYIPGFGTIEVCFDLDVDNKISDFEITGEYFSKLDMISLSKSFIKLEYNKDVIKDFVEKIPNFSDYFNTLKTEKLIELIIKT